LPDQLSNRNVFDSPEPPGTDLTKDVFRFHIAKGVNDKAQAAVSPKTVPQTVEQPFKAAMLAFVPAFR
jgi:hypothetical protein